jgi:uncharacterized membrane protein HdeD (DUF308 family)
MTSETPSGTDRTAGGLSQVGGSAGLTLGAGVVSLIVGVLVLSWPGATLGFLAVLFAIQLLVVGVLQVGMAFAAEGGAGSRVLLGLLGALSILVGLLCLRAPLQTVVVLGLLIGAVWVVGGVIGIVHAVGAERGSARGWGIVSGIVSVIGGAVVLVYPGVSLVVLTWLFGIVLVVNGVVLICRSIAMRRRHEVEPGVRQPHPA